MCEYRSMSSTGQSSESPHNLGSLSLEKGSGRGSVASVVMDGGHGDGDSWEGMGREEGDGEGENEDRKPVLFEGEECLNFFFARRDGLVAPSLLLRLRAINGRGLGGEICTVWLCNKGSQPPRSAVFSNSEGKRTGRVGEGLEEGGAGSWDRGVTRSSPSSGGEWRRGGEG